MAGDRRSTPTWQWIAVTAVGTLISVAAYAYVDTQQKISLKADKEMVNRIYDDVRDIKRMMEGHVIATGAGRVSRGDRR